MFSTPLPQLRFEELARVNDLNTVFEATEPNNTR